LEVLADLLQLGTQELLSVGDMLPQIFIVLPYHLDLVESFPIFFHDGILLRARLVQKVFFMGDRLLQVVHCILFQPIAKL